MENIFMYLQFCFEGWKKVDEVTTVALPPSSQYLEVYKKQWFGPGFHSFVVQPICRFVLDHFHFGKAVHITLKRIKLLLLYYVVQITKLLCVAEPFCTFS